MVFAKRPGPEWDRIPETTLNRTGYYPELNSTVHEISTVYGRCYSLHFHYDITDETEYFSIKFDMSQHQELLLYFHEDYNEVGLHWGFWPVKPTQLVLGKNVWYTVTSRRDKFKPIVDDGEKCEEEEEYSYQKCVVDWSRRTFKRMFENANISGYRHSII